jgi:site-specific recombinase XerD
MAFLTPNFWILPQKSNFATESPHLLRHSVATTLVERSIPIAQWQKFLGHSKLVTPQLYAASSTEMMRESSPRALSRCAR